jgi:hypothetical protein
VSAFKVQLWKLGPQPSPPLLFFLHNGALRNHDIAVRHFLSEARAPKIQEVTDAGCATERAPGFRLQPCSGRRRFEAGRIQAAEARALYTYLVEPATLERIGRFGADASGPLFRPLP